MEEQERPKGIQRCACCRRIRGGYHKMSCVYTYSAEAAKRQEWVTVEPAESDRPESEE
ncbi:hypothetical protein GCM10009802_20230 [Streptomyces synnematoformans]|uniref:Uncharacterized protein n=1 Tax=Streptomyces synnematoformans TaxID=415721 RepID=A0ABN2XVW4_9ACTN